MTLFFYIIIGIITFFAFLHAWAKKNYDISRIVVINKSKDEVFGFTRQLKKQPQWVPWFNRDPQAIVKYKGEDGKVGASSYWKGNTRVGEGTQKIVKIKKGKVFESKILFIKPVKVQALIYIGIKEIEPEKTKIVWGVRGHLPFPLTIISLFYSVDKLLGDDFEKGLKSLKALLESR